MECLICKIAFTIILGNNGLKSEIIIEAAVLPKSRPSTANSGTKAVDLPGMITCSSFPLLSAPHSLFSNWTDLIRSEKISEAPTWRLGEWIWLTGPSRFHRNSPKGLNINYISIKQIFPLNFLCLRYYHQYHQCVLLKGRCFTVNSVNKTAVLPKGRFSPQTRNQGAVLVGMNRYGSFSLFSAPHSLFNIWTDFEWSEKISGAPSWRWGEWIWLTGPSGLRWNSPQGLNISSNRDFDKIRDPEIPMTLHPLKINIDRNKFIVPYRF